MDRRTFTKAMLLSGTAAVTTPGLPAFANEDDEDRKNIGLPPYGRIRLLTPAIAVTLTLFLVMTSAGFFGVDLRTEVPQEPAKKMNLGKVPLLGSLFGQNLIKSFTGAYMVGTLYLLGSALILVPVFTTMLLLEHMWLTHRDVLYKPVPKPKQIRLKNAPTLAQVKSGRVVGKAVLRNSVLLAMLTPTVLDDMIFKTYIEGAK